MAALVFAIPVLAQSPQTNMYSNTNKMGYTNPLGMMPKFTQDFWKSIVSTRVPAGTVLTGILEDDLSSNKSRQGDVFSIRLQDGLVLNGVEVIPKQSKIICSVNNSISSKGLRSGQPGSVSISLQTLVFPDGSHTQFYGFIDHNPAQDAKHRVGQAPIDIANGSKRTVNSLVTLVTGRVGFPIRLNVPGEEFKLDKGEALPVRVTRPLDLSHMAHVPLNVPLNVPYGPGAPNSVQPDPVTLFRSQGPGPITQGLQAPAPLSLSDPSLNGNVPVGVPGAQGAPPVAPSRLLTTSPPAPYVDPF